MKSLGKKEIKKIIEGLKDYYGIKELKLDYEFFQNTNGKIYLITKEFKSFNAGSLRVNGLGLYFLNISKGLRLSIEGSQIVGKKATRNIHEIKEKDLKDWLRGYDLDCDEEIHGYMLVKNGDDFYGVGYAKEGRIKNFIPKYRRIKNV